MPSSQSAGLYIHFPYCVSICNYCDFDRQATGFASIPRYVAAVVTELRASAFRPIHSIFFGGGTPSLMTPDQVTSILTAASETFHVLPGCEITLEANPGECTVERLAGFRAAGVNRLSIGVQSLDDQTLEALSRRHTADEARAAVHAARQAGFDNLNLDFMLGLAGMTTDSWRGTLDAALALDPDHLSCYILTVDERVAMGRDVARGRIMLPNDDDVAAQYDLTREILAGAGYEQYEISNWAKPGRASRHNLTYWRDEPYLGIGAGAAGWVDGLRTKNTPSPRRFMTSVAAGQADRVEEERPDLATRLGDALALGLRLREGLDLDALGQRLGLDVRAILGEPLTDLTEAGCFEEHDGRLRVADASIMVTNELLVRLEGAAADWAASQRQPGAPEVTGSVVADAEPPAEIHQDVLAAGR